MLRAERKSGSELADIINAKISNGELVPSSITVTLIKNAMEKLYNEKKQTKFLIDGFPRGVENCSVWEEQMANISSIKCVLFMECPEGRSSPFFFMRNDTMLSTRLTCS